MAAKFNGQKIYDRRGNQIFEGDSVLSFNIMADGERIEDLRDGAPKIGVPVKLIIRNGFIYVQTGDGGTTGCNPDDPIYGVEKV